jgi:hypothetical protein
MKCDLVNIKVSSDCIVFNVQFFVVLLLFLSAQTFGIDTKWITNLRGDYSGLTACQFLTLPVSAKTLVRGQASSWGSMDATDVSVFIANTALSDRNKFTCTHLEWFMGIRKETLAGIIPLLDIGTVGFYTDFFTPGKIGHAMTIDEEPSKPSYFEYSAGISFARYFAQKRLNAGAGINFIDSHIDKINGRTMSGSLDFLYIPNDNISSHLYISNISPGITYNDFRESLPTQTGLSIRLNPFLSRLSKSNLTVSTGIGIRKIADQPLIAGLSTECTIASLISLRTGYEYTYGKDFSIEGFGAGGGIQLKKFGFDCGWKYQSEILGQAWAASINIQLEEILPKSSEEYYQIALKHYSRNRYSQCIYYAEKALKIDPNMWKAHALMSRAQSDILRSKDLEIGILYSGNNIGAFTTPTTPGKPGGLARQATALKKLQAQFPLNVTINAGNLLARTSSQTHTVIAGSFLSYIDFDAIGCGVEEFIIGPETINKEHKEADLEFILSNTVYTPSCVIKQKVVEKKHYRFYIASIINNALLDVNFKEKITSPPDLDNLPLIAKKCDVKILIVHDTWQTIQRNSSLYKHFDYVILGNQSQQFQAPLQIGSTQFLSAGSKGEYVGNLILQFNNNKQIINADNRLIPVTDIFPPDSFIEKKVAAISRKIDFTDNQDSVALRPGNSTSTFPFISNRNGINEIFLKVIEQNAEFPITGNALSCKAPVVSFKYHTINCLIDTDTGKNLLQMKIDGSDKFFGNQELYVKEIIKTPDENWLYFSGTRLAGKNRDFDIYRKRFDGGPTYPVVTWSKSEERFIAFSSRMDLMAYCSNREGNWQIYLTDTIGFNPIKITDYPGNHYNPAFNVNGTMLAYLSDRSNFGGKLDLWIYDRKARVHHQITDHSNVKEYCWIDNKTIAFSAGVNIFDLTSVDIDEYRFTKLLITNEPKSYSERNPRIITYRDTLKILYTKEFADGQKEIHWVNTNGTGHLCVIKNESGNWLPDFYK